MAGPLSGIVVIEAANWLAAPSAGALMADLGADVVKVEPPGGDPFRFYDQRASGYDHDFALNYAFELDNRGKRSITVDLAREGGPGLVRRLCERADVFLTNLTQPRRERYGLTDEALRAVCPSIIYASLTGYGTRGPDSERAGFDYSAFWARSGVMAALQQPPGAPPPLNRPGQGDHMTSLNLLAAVLAALRLRDQSGEGQYVEVTLQGSGMWSIGTDFSAALVAGQAAPRHDREAPANPIWNSYQTRDGRWIVLVMLQPDRYWDQFCSAIGRPDLALDGRGAAERFAEQGRELAETITDTFAEHDLAYWSRRLDEHGVIWAPAAELPEVIADPQVRELGWIRDVEHREAGTYQTLGTPFHIRSAELGPRGPAPAIGQHTFEVLREFGIADDERARLAERGVFG